MAVAFACQTVSLVLCRFLIAFVVSFSCLEERNTLIFFAMNGLYSFTLFILCFLFIRSYIFLHFYFLNGSQCCKLIFLTYQFIKFCNGDFFIVYSHGYTESTMFGIGFKDVWYLHRANSNIVKHTQF